MTQAIRRAATASVTGFAMAAATLAHAAPGDVTFLGTLGGYTSHATDVNNAGVVVGDSEQSPGRTHAFVWEGGTMRDLGALDPLNLSGAAAVNPFGIAAGFSRLPDGRMRAVKYDGVTVHNLGSLSSSHSHATGINGTGWVVGSSIINGAGATRAFLHDGTAMHDLGTLPTMGDSYAMDINGAGRIVGYASDTTAARHERAFYYDGETLNNIGTLPGWISVRAEAVNDHGQIAGTARLTSMAYRAFVYDDLAGLRQLSTLPATSGDHSANDVNRDGIVVGSGRLNLFQDPLRATLWQADGTIINLDAWLDSVNPAAGAGWTLTSAHAINDAGLVVGIAYDSSHAAQAFVLDVSSLVPEPGALTLLGVLGTRLCLRRRRR